MNINPISRPSSDRSSLDSTAGITLVEVMIAIAIIAIGAMGALAAIANSMAVNAMNRETTIATQAARAMIEDMNRVSFANRFIYFNATSLDDPIGEPDFPDVDNNNFRVAGLNPTAADPDGLAGEILFPVNALNQLIETPINADLGMPRNLGDPPGVDGGDYSTSYQILPVTIRIEWNGSTGDRVLEVHTLMIR